MSGRGNELPYRSSSASVRRKQESSKKKRIPASAGTTSGHRCPPRTPRRGYCVSEILRRFYLSLVHDSPCRKPCMPRFVLTWLSGSLPVLIAVLPGRLSCRRKQTEHKHDQPPHSVPYHDRDHGNRSQCYGYEDQAVFLREEPTEDEQPHCGDKNNECGYCPRS